MVEEEHLLVEGVMKAMVGLVRVATIAIRENLIIFAALLCIKYCV